MPTFRQYAHTFQSRLGRNKNTHDTDEATRLNHIEPSKLGRTPVDRVTRGTLQDWVDELRKLDGGAMKPASVRRAFAFVTMLLSTAAKEGLIQHSPAVGIKLPQVKERRNRVLSFSELSQLLSNPTEEIDRIAVVSATMGLSRHEVVKLRWDGRRGKQWHVPGTKRDSRDRMVPLTPAALRAIRQQPRTGELIFPLHPSTITHRWAKRRAELGMPAETRFQDLRGTYVSLLIRSGADPRTVMELVGHTKVETTLKAYARSDDETRSNAVRAMMRRVPKGRKGKA